MQSINQIILQLKDGTPHNSLKTTEFQIQEVAIYAKEMVDHLKLYILPFTITKNREHCDMPIGIDRH